METISFNSLSLIERLDKTLSFIAYKKSVSSNDIMLEFQRLNTPAKELIDILIVLDKLKEDKYIKEVLLHANYGDFQITLQGEYFCQMGGYAQDQKEKNYQKNRLLKIEHNQYKLQITMNALTVILTIGTCVQAVFCIIQMFEGLLKPHPYIASMLCLFVLLSISWLMVYYQKKYKV
jgi:hypothetical protein